ncbi:hypothetical protein [Kosakonia sp.]|uniref:hypothetical protein n=1 Tax=Kosakonia sp. TaxID=1916651 RepID=UPI00289FF7F3|nr:hypothetical protein [Kosakonia sp.]
MKAMVALAGALLLSGCSTYNMFKEYNQSIKDYTGQNRVGVAFDLANTQARIYPETDRCINLYSNKNGFIGSGSMTGDHKRIGVPYVAGMSQNRDEYWVSAEKFISVRILYAGRDGSGGILTNQARVNERYVTFQPEPGAYYYVKVERPDTSHLAERYLKVYKIVVHESGRKELEPVREWGIHNCPGQKPWYRVNGATI